MLEHSSYDCKSRVKRNYKVFTFRSILSVGGKVLSAAKLSVAKFMSLSVAKFFDSYCVVVIWKFVEFLFSRASYPVTSCF